MMIVLLAMSTLCGYGCAERDEVKTSVLNWDVRYTLTPCIDGDCRRDDLAICRSDSRQLGGLELGRKSEAQAPEPRREQRFWWSS
jgi:hypothetical protein